MKALIAARYYEALHRAEPWAIKIGLRNRMNWALEGTGEPDRDNGLEAQPTINVTFHLPGRKDEPPVPLDLAPQPDYSRPALLKPPERQHTPFGIVERPSKDGLAQAALIRSAAAIVVIGPEPPIDHPVDT
jgi:hypothetical protein